MAGISATVDIDAPVAEVWDDLRHIDRHVEWMHDAVAIRFLTDATSGEGVRFDCDTRVGPIRLTDRMEITEWVEPRVIGVRHVGLVTGEGRFTLVPRGDDRTTFLWHEELAFPWWLGGPIGAVLGGVVLRLVWRRNLTVFAARFDRRSGARR